MKKVFKRTVFLLLGIFLAIVIIVASLFWNELRSLNSITTTTIRLILDKAASVDEAIQLLNNYNIYFSWGIDCHYLISDATGRSVIIEYYKGKVVVVESEDNYQIASNFIAYNGVNIGEGFTEFDRYNAVKKEIISNNNVLSNKQAINLLASVGVWDDNIDKLQWSVLYNLTTGDIEAFAHRNTDNIITASLDLAIDD